MALLPRRSGLLALVAATAVVVPLSPIATGTALAASLPAGPSSLTVQDAASASSVAGYVKDPVLSWASDGATTYQVQLSPDADWTNDTVTLPNEGKTPNTVYELPLSLPYAHYYWRVRGLVGGSWTGWTQAANPFLHEWYSPFSLLKAPTDTDPSLAWTPVPEASIYQVRFALSPDFSDALDCWTVATQFTPYDLLSKTEQAPNSCFGLDKLTNGETYHWEVVAWDDSQAAAIAADDVNDPSYECASAQPACDAYRLGWNGQGGGSGTFTLDAPRADRSSTPDVADISTMTTSWHSSTLPGTACGTTCPVTPTFTWNTVTGANLYRVQVYWDPERTNTYRTYEVPASPDQGTVSFTPRDDFYDATAPSAAWYWTVIAETCQNSATDPQCSVTDADTSATATCPNPSSATDIPQVTGVAASSGAAIPGGSEVTVTLTGNGFADGDCVTPSVGTIVGPVSYDSSSGSLSFPYAAPLAKGSVSFTVTTPDGAVSGPSSTIQITQGQRVEPIHTVDSGGACSDSSGTPEGCFSKTSAPATPDTDRTASLFNQATHTFFWNDWLTSTSPEDVENYELQVTTSDDPDFTNPVLDVQDLDLTRYTLMSPLADGTYLWRVAGVDEAGHLLPWSAAKDLTVDASSPKLTLTATTANPLRPVFHVTSSEPLDASTVTSSSLRVVPTFATGSPVTATLSEGSGDNTWLLTTTSNLVTGGTYQLDDKALQAITDLNGNHAVDAGKTVRVTTVADDGSAAWGYSTGWVRHTASNALGGSFREAPTGRTATVTVAGSAVYVYGCKGPSFGTLGVTVDGTRKATVNEHQSFTKCGVLLWSAPESTTAKHTVVLSVASGYATLDEVKVS